MAFNEIILIFLVVAVTLPACIAMCVLVADIFIFASIPYWIGYWRTEGGGSLKHFRLAILYTRGTFIIDSAFFVFVPSLVVILWRNTLEPDLIAKYIESLDFVLPVWIASLFFLFLALLPGSVFCLVKSRRIYLWTVDQTEKS